MHDVVSPVGVFLSACVAAFAVVAIVVASNARCSNRVNAPQVTYRQACVDAHTGIVFQHDGPKGAKQIFTTSLMKMAGRLTDPNGTLLFRDERGEEAEGTRVGP